MRCHRFAVPKLGRRRAHLGRSPFVYPSFIPLSIYLHTSRTAEEPNQAHFGDAPQCAESAPSGRILRSSAVSFSVVRPGYLADSIVSDLAGVMTPESPPFLSGGGHSLSLTPGSDPVVAQSPPERQCIGSYSGAQQPEEESCSAHSPEGSPPCPGRYRSPCRPRRHPTTDTAHPTSHRRFRAAVPSTQGRFRFQRVRVRQDPG